MDSSEELIVALVLLVISTAIVYEKIYLVNKRDVHELSLKEQSSISSTRKTGESAIYRSLDVMHGLPLTVGLQVRYDIYKIRNGNVKDIWKLAMEQSENKIIFINDDTREEKTLKELNQIFYKISKEINRVGEGKQVAIYAPWQDPRLLMVILSSFFYTDHTIHNFTKMPQLGDDNIGLIFCYKRYVTQFMELGYKKFFVLDGVDKDISFESILHSDSSITEYQYEYSKGDDLTKVFIDTANYKQFEYSQINFVSLIASQLRSLPLEHLWHKGDKLMIEVSDSMAVSNSVLLLNQNLLVKLLCGLLSHVGEIYVVSSDVLDMNLVKSIRPTIMALSELKLSQKIFQEIPSSMTFYQTQKLKFSSNWFSRGIHNELFQHSEIPKLRLIYSEVYNQPSLSTLQINNLQLLFSARIVVERFRSPIIGPILKTNFYDYRVLLNDTQDNKISLKKLGVPSNCLEFKLRDHGEWEAEFDEGELMCRGFNIGKSLNLQTADQEGWMGLGIFGKWGDDGCFYEYL